MADKLAGWFVRLGLLVSVIASEVGLSRRSNRHLWPLGLLRRECVVIACPCALGWRAMSIDWSGVRAVGAQIGVLIRRCEALELDGEVRTQGPWDNNRDLDRGQTQVDKLRLANVSGDEA